MEHPQKVFVVHGEEETAVSFADHVRAELGLDSYAPYSGDAFDLITGAQIREGSREYVVKKQEQKRIYSTKNSVYYRLESEGERLNAVIKKCQGMANKDLAKFADQIHALAEKWDR